MNTAVINIKIQPSLKKEAVKVANDFGLSLSALINALLKQVVRSKTMTLSATYEPSPYLIKALKESARDIKNGRVSPTFTNADDAIKWLENPKKKYAGKVQ